MQNFALDQPAAEPDGHLAARRDSETRELALLAQFMRHDSVVSLASEIAERLGGTMRGGDLIAAAGLSASRADRRRCAPSSEGRDP